VPSRKKPAFESIDWDKVDMADLDSDLEDEDENENKPVDMMQKYLDSLNPGLRLTSLLFSIVCTCALRHASMLLVCLLACLLACGTHDLHDVVSLQRSRSVRGKRKRKS
jgi:hypothetical protein